jgi:hypothetical protein
MASTLGSLVISLAVDTAKFQGDLGKAATLAESRMRNIKDTAAKAMAAVTIAATAAGTALVVSLKKAIDRADDFRDMAQSAGTTVEQFSRLAYAGKTAGIEVEQIGKALAKLASSGAPDANAALLALADRFASMPDGAEKTALAVDYLGEKLGPKMIPLLNLGSEGLAKLAQQSDALGFTIRREAAEGADEFNDSLVALGTVATGFTNQLAAELLPALNAVTGSLVEAAEEGDNTRRFIESLAYVLKGFIELGLNVSLSLGAMGSALGALAAASVAAAEGDLSRAKDILIEANNEQLESEARTNAKIAEIWQERVSAAEQMNSRLAAISRQPAQANPVLQRAALPKTADELAAQKEAERKAAAAAAQAARERAAALKEHANAYQDVLTSGLQVMRSLETPHEAIMRNFEEQKYALENLAATYPAFAAEAQEAIERLAVITDDHLEDLKRIPPVVEQAKNEWGVFAEEAARNMQGHFAQFFYSFDGGLKGMVSGFADTLRKMVAELAAQELLRSFFGWGKDNFKGSWLGDLFGGLYDGVAARATGGPVSGGSPYLVGERGPELFVPGSSGSIVPNHALAGGINLTVAPVYHMDNRGATQDFIAALPAILEANSRRTVEMTKASIRNDLKRSGRVR